MKALVSLGRTEENICEPTGNAQEIFFVLFVCLVCVVLGILELTQ